MRFNLLAAGPKAEGNQQVYSGGFSGAGEAGIFQGPRNRRQFTLYC